MKVLMAGLVVMMVSGCATNYGTYQRDSEGNISASGKAAVEAARSTKTIRCEGCTPSIGSMMLTHYDDVPHRHRANGECIYPSSWKSHQDYVDWKNNRVQRDRSNELLNNSMNTVQSEIQTNVNRKIREIFR